MLRRTVFFFVGSSYADFGCGLGAGGAFRSGAAEVVSGASCMRPIVPVRACEVAQGEALHRVDRATAPQGAAAAAECASSGRTTVPFARDRETCDDRTVTATFLIAGEALTDIVVDADGARREHPGGSPMNVAVALSRLGHPTELLTRIGDDARGDAIRAHLEESGVRLTPGSSVAAATSTALAQLDATGAATYQFDLLWDPNPAGLPEQVDAVHTSSIAAVLEPGAATVLDLLRSRRDSATISYDPNARPTLMGDAAAARERIEASITLSDVVKASDEDVAWLYDTDDVEDVVDGWRALGPALTVLTRGGEGAVGFAGSGRVQVSPVMVEAVDTVGAGDTFSAGILDALAGKDLLGAAKRPALTALPSDEVAAVLQHAARLAAITVSRAGANPPWSHELT